ncbi:MAG: PEP/pyruvate-binding domain-containing protein [Pseudonocardiaceae bacterium]
MGSPLDLPISQGASEVPDRATFEVLAARDDVPGALGAREVKFLMLGVNEDQPRLYFANTNTYSFHYDFATGALGVDVSLGEFNAQTYFRDDRANLAGTVIAHDGFESPEGGRGLYAMEFWPTDPVKAHHVALAFRAIGEAMPFADAQLAYHPAGDTQEALYREERAQFDQLGVRVVETSTLFGNVSYTPLNLGEGYGTLRVVDPTQVGARPATIRDVAIFSTLPNDISHLAGILSETPQTPLSHINLKAKQNDTPNAYVRGASTDPRITPFLDRLVHYVVTPDSFVLESATQAQVDSWLERLRPPHPQLPRRDLGPREIVDLDQLRNSDTAAFGAKAANLGELRTIFPAEMVPGGYAIPFSFYDDFMTANGLYDEVACMIADADFQSDPAVRERMLDDFRRTRVRRGELSAELASRIAELQARFGDGVPIRCRSSTNNEDVEGFNGAGLYDSFTHRPDEGALEKTIKQVLASLWNFRAFDERDFYRIDHLHAAMGVAVHRNFDDEVANGVAITKNPYEPDWPGFYVNVQVGESLVTNPDPAAVPDELLISAIGPQGEWETQFIRHSSLTTGGEPVLSTIHLDELRRALQRLHVHFKRVYQRQDDDAFAMDIEFKIDINDQLVIKQARPWVD